MEYINHVDSEGGPFLLADITAAKSWLGVEDDGSDYERACHALLDQVPGAQIYIDQNAVVIWDLGGAGTVDVFKKDDTVIIVHAWLDSSDHLDDVASLAALPLIEPVSIGTLNIKSGILTILWAPESGGAIEASDIKLLASEGYVRPSGEMASASGGLLFHVTTGKYSCYHDEVQMGNTSARRCHVIKE